MEFQIVTFEASNASNISDEDEEQKITKQMESALCSKALFIAFALAFQFQ